MVPVSRPLPSAGAKPAVAAPGVLAALVVVALAEARVDTSGYPAGLAAVPTDGGATPLRASAVVLAVLGGGPLVAVVGDVVGTSAAIGPRPRVAKLVAVVAAVSPAGPV